MVRWALLSIAAGSSTASETVAAWAFDGTIPSWGDPLCGTNGQQIVTCCKPKDDWSKNCFETVDHFSMDGSPAPAPEHFDTYVVDDAACTGGEAGPKPDGACEALEYKWECTAGLHDSWSFGFGDDDESLYTTDACSLPCPTELPDNAEAGSTYERMIRCMAGEDTGVGDYEGAAMVNRCGCKPQECKIEVPDAPTEGEEEDMDLDPASFLSGECKALFDAMECEECADDPAASGMFDRRLGTADRSAKSFPARLRSLKTDAKARVKRWAKSGRSPQQMAAEALRELQPNARRLAGMCDDMLSGGGGMTSGAVDEESRGPPSVSRPADCHSDGGAAVDVDCSACALLAASTLKQMQNKGCWDQVISGMQAATEDSLKEAQASGDEDEAGMAQFAMMLVGMMISALPGMIETTVQTIEVGCARHDGQMCSDLVPASVLGMQVADPTGFADALAAVKADSEACSALKASGCCSATTVNGLFKTQVLGMKAAQGQLTMMAGMADDDQAASIAMMTTMMESCVEAMVEEQEDAVSGLLSSCGQEQKCALALQGETCATTDHAGKAEADLEDAFVAAESAEPLPEPSIKDVLEGGGGGGGDDDDDDDETSGAIALGLALTAAW